MLASLLGEHADLLEADYQEHYHLNLYEVPPLRAARLLPRLLHHWDTAIYRTLNPEWEWGSLQTRLLGMQADALNLLWWAKTKDGQKNRNRPKSVFPQADKGRMKGAVSMPIDELKAYLARPRSALVAADA